MPDELTERTYAVRLSARVWQDVLDIVADADYEMTDALVAIHAAITAAAGEVD